MNLMCLMAFYTLNPSIGLILDKLTKGGSVENTTD